MTLPSESTLEILKLSVATKVNVSVKYVSGCGLVTRLICCYSYECLKYMVVDAFIV